MFHNKKMLSIVAVLCLFSLLLAACPAPAAPATGGSQEATAPTAEEKAPIKIGGIADLTGPTSDIGTGAADGLAAYVKYANENGGIEGHPIEFLTQDYQYKVDIAEQLYTQFIDEGVVTFMGWGTGDTEALRTKIAADQIPFMSASFSASLNNQEEAPYNFLIGTTYSDQMVISLKWILEDWKAKGNADAPKVAFLHNDSPFGLSPLADGQAFADDNGIEITAIPMPRGATDLTPELTQVTSAGAGYIIIQNVPTPAVLLLKNKQALGMDDVQVVCLNYCTFELTISLSEGAAEGLVGAMPFTPVSIEVPGQQPMRDWAKANGVDLDKAGTQFAQGWLAMELMVEGIRRTIKDGKELTGENIKAAYETFKEYDTGGRSAPLTFTADEHRGNRSLRLFQVKDGKWTQLTDFLTAE
jgi:branched-chain amino acid transport system substrate-binding protein